MGYLETVTHSLISPAHAQQFLPPGMVAMRVDEARAAAEPELRPSIVPSLLRVFAHNRDNGVKNVRLFETGSTFAWSSDSMDEHLERVNLAIVHPAASPEDGLRRMRGVIDRLVQIILGRTSALMFEPSDHLPWLRADAGAVVRRMNGDTWACYGIVEPKVAKLFDVDETIFAAEIGLPAFYVQVSPTDARPRPAELPGNRARSFGDS
jgi:phenylalanyl-tRNA synthetase beta subunit